MLEQQVRLILTFVQYGALLRHAATGSAPTKLLILDDLMFDIVVKVVIFILARILSC